MCNCATAGMNPFFGNWPLSSTGQGFNQTPCTSSIFSTTCNGTSVPQYNNGQAGSFDPMMIPMMWLMGSICGKKNQNTEKSNVEKSYEPAEEDLEEDDNNQISAREALEIIKANFSIIDTIDGKANQKVHIRDLQKIVDTNGYSQELKDAAQFLLNHRDIFDNMEKANDKDNDKDEKFTIGDIDKYIEENPSFVDKKFDI